MDSSGDAWAFGNGDEGQLGMPGNPRTIAVPVKITTLESVVSVSCGLFHTVCCDSQGVLRTFGMNSFGQLGLGDLQKRSVPTVVDKIHPDPSYEMPLVTFVACGSYHTTCIDNSGYVWAFGRNQSYQLELDHEGTC